MMEGASLRKGAVCSCTRYYIRGLTKPKQHLCCRVGRSVAARRWHRYGRLGTLTCRKREGIGQ